MKTTNKTVINKIGCILFSIVNMGCVPSSSEQSYTKAERMVSLYYDTFQNKPFNVDDLMSFYNDSIYFIDPTFEIAVKGKEDVRKLYAVADTKESSYTSIKWTIITVVASNDDIVINGRWSGEYKGAPFDIPFTTLWKIANGKIMAQQDYFAASMWDKQVDYWTKESENN